jgi:hypothetical protein
MAAHLGSYGAAAYVGDDFPKSADYVCIGDSNGIASPQEMQQSVIVLKGTRIDAEFHLFPNLGHGFGLGIGTTAEDWHNGALAILEKHIAEMIRE